MENIETFRDETGPKRFFCFVKDKVEGPFDVIELAAHIKYGTIDGDTLLCREGSEVYFPFRELPEFAVAREISIEEIARHLQEKERLAASGLSEKKPTFSWGIYAIMAVALLGVAAFFYAQGADTAQKHHQDSTHFVFPRQYRATMEVTMGNFHGSSTIFADNEKLRMETDLGSGVIGAVIIRRDTHKIFQVMVSQRIVIERPYFVSKGAEASAVGPDSKYEDIGTETIDGVPCTKYRVSVDENVWLLWVDTAKQVPVKMMRPNNGSTVNYKSYEPGPQDPALFEPPADYKWIN